VRGKSSGKGKQARADEARMKDMLAKRGGRWIEDA
jgi:hypothetical protein